MGNDPSKREDKDEASQPLRRQDRGLPDIATRSAKVVSRALPVEPPWYESPDTPTSEVSFNDSDFDSDRNRAAPSPRSFKPQTLLLDEAFEDEPSSMALQQLLYLFVHGPHSMQLEVGCLDFPSIEKLTFVAKCIGFETCGFDVPYVRLVRSTETDIADMRSVAAHQSLKRNEQKLNEMGLLDVDAAVEECLMSHLIQTVKSKMSENVTVLMEMDSRGFLLPQHVVEKIFKSVAETCQLSLQRSTENRIAVIVPEGAKSERTIQKGELVWRRLQHWSTNVRKEKKFNIWAKGLADDVKQRILQIALEIGFETAMIQPNGNIHLEIKPPEGQHRRKLKHATDELRAELEPIDDAVCQNVEQHLTEWLSEFQRNGKQKDVLNCRFVLPAEWLRQTSEKLANQYGLCVSMETGIDLLFYRPEVDLKLIQETASKEASKKQKSQKKTKKKIPDPPVTTEAMSNGQHVIAEQERPSPLFDARMNDAVRATPIQLANRRTSSRSKYDYGWDPSWPTAHPERAATSQHTY